tara:strand:+ start:856 stop:987 length:132 start_codon:yes stop_codon:yes gene_type:complete
MDSIKENVEVEKVSQCNKGLKVFVFIYFYQLQNDFTYVMEKDN